MLDRALTGSTSSSTNSVPPDESAPDLTHGGLGYVDPPAEAPPPPAPRGVAWPFGIEAVSEALEVVALALVMFMAVRFVAQHYIVDGSSMAPNFHQGDLLLLNKLAYRSFDLSWLPGSDNDTWRPFGDPRPGDVVVFRFPHNTDRDFIKRVAAVPGQTVELRQGLLYIDGVQVAEPYIAEPGRFDFPPQMVPEGKLFVLGDNRMNSYDSRAWGMLDRGLVIGRVELRYWPPRAAGLIDQYRPEGGVPAAGLSGVSTSP